MKTLAALLKFLMGYACFLIKGRTPHYAYAAMRRLYGYTDGRFNDACLLLAQRFKPQRVTGIDGFLGHWSAQDLQMLAQQLERDGIAMLGRPLPEAFCGELEIYARSTPSLPMGHAQEEVYSAENACALRYDFSQQTLKAQPAVQRIARDGTFEAIAAAYFGCRPVFDFVTMWWTTGKGPRDFSGAAQQFHYDMDRLFFLKFFVYLSDVSAESGPHVYVAGSHRRKPRALRGDRRYDDAEIERYYPSERILRICGPRGTVFAADTRGMHKGEPVRQGDRLVLQVEFALNKFGQNYA